MTATLNYLRTLRVLVADPQAEGYERLPSETVELEICTTGREALRHMDEPLDFVVLSTSLGDIAFQDVAEMFRSAANSVSLIVVSESTSAAEESLARQVGAVLYRQRSTDLEWLADLCPRRSVARGPAPRLTLDWQRRPQRFRERAAACER
jgi:hypothetical protein